VIKQLVLTWVCERSSRMMYMS